MNEPDSPTSPQTSDVGSIPIARSINIVDSVALALLKLEIGANWTEFWTQVGPNFDRTPLMKQFSIGTLAVV